MMAMTLSPSFSFIRSTEASEIVDDRLTSVDPDRDFGHDRAALDRGDLSPGLISGGELHHVLDESFQTNVPGLFITSMAAAQDFGPDWGFAISVRTSAKLIGRALVG